jgi:hypothetical protein
MNEMTTFADLKQSMVASPAPRAPLANREAQEVQAAVFMAKQFPRDENMALARINQSCQRIGLASKAVYTYPRGGQNVTGPSIRLAEAMAHAWGNIQCGVVELEQRPGESVCMAYCWDVETNTRDCRTFTVPHVRSTKNGLQTLTDPRDIYELVANQGARRKRACILAVIPKDIVDYAVDCCQRTLASGHKEPLIDRLRNLVTHFQKTFSVPLESIERYMGYKLDAFTETDGATLAGIFNALKDGAAKREDYFVLPKAKDPEPDEQPQTTDEPKSNKKVKLHDL